MRIYRIGADVADPRGFGDKVKVYGIYLFLDGAEKLKLFDYKKFGVKRESIAYITYQLKGAETGEEMEAQFYATLLAQGYTVYDVGEVEKIEN